MYRLIALDVDGTLLDSHHELAPVTAEVIAQAQARGVHVVLATGKQPITIAHLIEQLALTAPQITSHGALATDPQTGTVLYEQGIPAESGRQVITIGQELGVTMVVVGHGKTYATARNRDIDYMLTYGDPVPDILPDLTLALDPPPTHITALAYQQDTLYAAAYERFSAALGDQLNVYRSSPYYIEFLHPLSSKGHALAEVCRHLGIEAADVMAVGDSFNDLSMFDFAGLSLAMGQSPEGVQQHADRVLPSNDEHGVAYAIQTWVLG